MITDDLFKAKDMNYTLQTEIEYVRENYYINESDAQSVRQFENEIQNLISVYDDILKEMSKSAVRYSEVQDNLQYLEDHVQSLMKSKISFKITLFSYVKMKRKQKTTY